MYPNPHCRVCGLDQGYSLRDERDHPDYTICECCGTEFGVDDDMLGQIRQRRKNWLDSGAKWFDPKVKPTDWELERQLKNIPIEFR